MNYKLAVFDLDGTLISSHKTIYETTLRTLRELGIRAEISEEKFLGTIGHHFREIFEQLNIPVTDVDHFIDTYKPFYFDYIDSSEFYPGVVSTLKELSESGIKVSLLTTKNQEQAKKICSYFSIDKYFDYIMGRRPGVAEKPSAEPLLFICDNLDIAPEDALIVGDSELDILCGKAAGSETCGVTYGYRTKKQLKAVNPDFIIDEFIQLENIIFNGRYL